MPHDHPTLIIGHEFLDALPIQKFQYTKKGWREVLIDLKDHVDWAVDEELENKVKGDDHASLSLEKAVAAEPASRWESETPICVALCGCRLAFLYAPGSGLR